VKPPPKRGNSNLQRNSIAAAAGGLAASQYVAAAVGFVTITVAARLLGPADYGTAALVIAYPSLVWSFVAFKPVSVLTRFLTLFRANGQQMEAIRICKLGYAVDLSTAMIAALVVALSGHWVAGAVYHRGDLGWLIVAYALSLPLSSLAGTSFAILTSWQRFGWLGGLQLCDRVVALFFVVVALQLGFGLPGMVIATAAAHALSGLLAAGVAVYAMHRSGVRGWWHAPLRMTSEFRNELSRLFAWNYLTVTLGGLVSEVPIMLLGRFRGPEEAGFYRLAFSAVTMASYAESALGRVVYPLLCARAATGGRGRDLVTTLVRWTLVGGVPLFASFLGGALLLPVVIPAVLGTSYQPMVLGCQLMMIGVAITGLCFWLQASYYASARFGFWAKMFAGYAAVVVVAAWFTVAHSGFLALAGVMSLLKVAFTVTMAALVLKLDSPTAGGIGRVKMRAAPVEGN
jgi:O-antigen/teichoic acid export membrane protein